MGKTIEKVLNNKLKLRLAGAASIIVSYVFVSLAIDSASLWQYLLTIVFFVAGIKLFIRSFKTHGNK